MNKQTEALKMAIEFLNDIGEQTYAIHGWQKIEKLNATIQSCKEALAQPAQKSYEQSWYDTHPAQEPVAWNEEEFNAIAYAYRSCPAHEVKMVSERYQELVNYVLSITHPAPSWQGLSDDEINNLHHKWIMNSGNKDTQYDFARAIEQALRNKNGY